MYKCSQYCKLNFFALLTIENFFQRKIFAIFFQQYNVMIFMKKNEKEGRLMKRLLAPAILADSNVSRVLCAANPNGKIS